MVATAKPDSYTIFSRSRGEKVAVISEGDNGDACAIVYHQGQAVASLTVCDGQPVIILNNDAGTAAAGVSIVDGVPVIVPL